VLAEVTTVSCKGDIASLVLLQSPAPISYAWSSRVDYLGIEWSIHLSSDLEVGTLKRITCSNAQTKLPVQFSCFRS
jgi:hypothetical protein